MLKYLTSIDHFVKIRSRWKSIIKEREGLLLDTRQPVQGGLVRGGEGGWMGRGDVRMEGGGDGEGGVAGRGGGGGLGGKEGSRFGRVQHRATHKERNSAQIECFSFEKVKVKIKQ